MEDHERRLAAIVVCDVVGFSRMMADDESGTLSSLTAHRNAFDPVILNHGGRIIKNTGDGVLVEFPSAVAAVEAAAEVQAVMEGRNADLPESRHMTFRIGINLGDVLVDQNGDVFGDGVNVAARLEALADPGGVAISNAVYEAVRGKTALGFIDDGDHSLKNIPTPVRVWKVGAPTTPPPAAPSKPRVVATLAVMPFDNMSGDSDQEYFADGITEDLITALSRDRTLAVIARNSTFAYKGSPIDIRTVARELDASHVVEGSVRRSGNRLRVTAQLIDAESGHHAWAERYDRDLSDIFELQDELVDAITSRLRPMLLESEGRRRSEDDHSSFDAWDLTLRGWFEVNKHTIESWLAGLRLFEEAVRLEPESADAIAGVANTWLWLALGGWRDEAINPWERSREAAEKVYRLDPDHYLGLMALAMVRNMAGEVEEGLRHAERLVAINPHAAAGYHAKGAALYLGGRADEAVPVQTEAWRLARHEPWRYDTANDLAYTHYLLDNYEAAARWGDEALAIADWLQSRIAMAATRGQLGGPDAARPHVEAILRARPDFTCAQHRTRLAFRRSEDRDHLIEGLRKAGLPE